MTYREKIQQMIQQINKLYNDAEGLRDMALMQEKEYWNKHRGIFYDAAKPLRMLDDSLSYASANRCICNDCTKVRKWIPCEGCGTEIKVEVQVCKDCNEEYPGYARCENCE